MSTKLNVAFSERKTNDRQTSSTTMTTTTTMALATGKWISHELSSFFIASHVSSAYSDDLTITQFCKWSRGDTEGELCAIGC